jgi:hypothetical protein
MRGLIAERHPPVPQSTCAAMILIDGQDLRGKDRYSREERPGGFLDDFADRPWYD